MSPLMTIAETSSFQKRAEKRLSIGELDAIRDLLAAEPTRGDVIRGGGGLRKLRFGVGGRGKSGGVRVIYYYYDEQVPLYLLDIYAKNEKDDLSDEELAGLAQLAKALAVAAKARRRR